MKLILLIKYILLPLTFLCFLSCDDEKQLVGPCVHTYKEPILHITSIRDTTNNKNFSFVTLRSLKVNGFPRSGYYSLGESYSIVSNDSIFYCNIPFGLGIQDGKYEFVIEAEGYPPKHITIDNVDYSTYGGGCPSYNDGGKRVDLIIN